MDRWFYFDVIHTLHTWCNPISTAGVRDMEQILDLGPETRVLDVACGCGEMLIGFAERHGCRGVGVDLSPYALERAEARREARVRSSDVTFLHLDGKDYRSDALFDVAMCIGASWIWAGYEGTLDAMTAHVRPGGLVVTGEPYWRAEEGPPEYLAAEEIQPGEFTTLDGYHAAAKARGLRLVWMRGSTPDEWDRYEMLQTASFDRFSEAQPDHPDRAEIEARLAVSKDAFLRWGRDALGFAIWVHRKPLVDATSGKAAVTART